MSCIINQSVQQTYVETQSNGAVTSAVNGNWLQAYCEFLGVTEPVNSSWLQALCLHFGITQPLFGSWTIALANYYGILAPENGSWWNALACQPGGPVVPDFIWNLDTLLWETEDRVWNTGVAAEVVAEFSANLVAPEIGQSVTFTDDSTGVPTEWAWVFPGGTPATSTAQNPTVQYNTIGQFDVTLTASKSGSTDTITKVNFIDAVAIPQIVADFVADDTNPQINTDVTFTDTSTNNPTSWSWTLEGATPATSNVQNPVVQYTTVGLFDATLVASKTGSTDTEVKIDYIDAISQPFIPTVLNTWVNGIGIQYMNIGSQVTVADLALKVPNTPYTHKLTGLI